MSQRLIPLPALIGMVTIAGFAAAAGASTGSNSTIQLIAMDADPTGNGATTLDHLDPCVRAEPGSEVTVDLIVDAVPADRPLIGFELHIKYDPNVLEVIAIDNGFLLGAVGTFDAFDALSDTLPDSDGDFLLAVADLASNGPPGANMETGKGVLTRVTFKAKSIGISDVAPGFAPPEVYPALYDNQNTTIEVRTIAAIKVAVGEDCPPGQTEIEPTELPSIPSLEGSPTPTHTSAPTLAVTLAPTPKALPATGGAPAAGHPIPLALSALVFAILAGSAWVATRR